jgi:hypothetical protein
MTKGSSLRRFWTLTALVVLAQLFVVQVMAASPKVHERLHHHDCDHGQGNECVVSLMLHGGYANVSPDIVPVEKTAESPQVWVTVPQATDTVAMHLRGGVLAHAPPRGP